MLALENSGHRSVPEGGGGARTSRSTCVPWPVSENGVRSKTDQSKMPLKETKAISGEVVVFPVALAFWSFLGLILYIFCGECFKKP